MATKLNRGRTTVFRKRRPIGKIVLTVLVCVLLIGGGVLLAYSLAGNTPSDPTPTPTPSNGGGSSTSASTTTTTVTTTTKPPVSQQALRAIYVTVDQLRDTNALQTLVKQAAKAGYNGVIFDLKDSQGVLHYASETAQSLSAGAISDTALTRAELQAAAKLCRDNGVEPIPRLYAFRDRTAPKKLKDARVKLKGSPSILWLDRKKSEGGKPWLNPCSEEAQSYVLGLCAELKEWGFTVQRMDGVQFPEKDDRADYGDGELAKLSKGEVLARFIDRAESVMGQNGVLWIGSPAAAALGTETDGYEQATVTLGASKLAVDLSADALGKKVSYGNESAVPSKDLPNSVRLALAALKATAGDTTLIPEIPSGNTALLNEIKQAGYPSYVVYNENGTYSF